MEETRNLRRTIQGVVTSNKMEKGITVTVERKVKHPKYGKFVKKSKKYHAHDESNDANVGDVVRIMETRPLSKLKRWRLVDIIERAK
ncbi:MAG: 30S ribosomal protein S17 [Chitinophagales bacterium]|nr:30S ribosomal protein S17 [Chitinophagales bacterium]HAE14357.1 30S ribosomal protein S17 [Bacteroidota bacterium]MCB9022076.1 30S ribosomal protein S17 [Chitinophagales bacterium]MCB9031805.1 30S ribosomal protein S17 [Chitinophagales bacterium]HPE96653.1 30S ribosomal protein S17 [Chitinophagales bacterium]